MRPVRVGFFGDTLRKPLEKQGIPYHLAVTLIQNKLQKSACLFCNIPIGRFSPIFSLKTTKARVIQNEACKYIGVKPDLYDPETIFANTHRSCFTPEMDHTEREARTMVGRKPCGKR